MGYYFDENESISCLSHGNTLHTLSVMAGRYMAENPEYGYTARPFSCCGIMRSKDYRYVFDANHFFPDAACGEYVYLWGKINCAAAGSLRFTLIPYGPAKIWINGSVTYATDFAAERFADTAQTFDIPVQSGWNHLVLRFTKTKAGFGAEFGTWLGKLDYFFLHGSPVWEQMEGFDYTAPTSEHITDLPAGIADKVLPLPEWSSAQKKSGDLARVFASAQDNPAGRKIAARSSFVISDKETIAVKMSGTGRRNIYIDGKPAAESIEAEKGTHSVLVIIFVDKNYIPGSTLDTGVQLFSAGGRPVKLKNPLLADDDRFPWMYAGPFAKTDESALIPFDPELLAGTDDEKTWWRIDLPGGWIRLYNENRLFGHWDYPLGVTLYGLIETARLFDSRNQAESIGTYVEHHVAKSVRTLDYALFDKAHFGGATAVHHLLTSIDSLDDCGSFGSLMLETAKDRAAAIGDYGTVAWYIGSYICTKQARLEDGSFWRRQMMHKFHNGTMWADDLYMSVPFLCRYAAFTKDGSVLDDAARQFIGFKKRLYMPEKKLMAHVYDFRREMNTGVPWGRGNGWTLFSLTELLLVLPQNHKLREELLSFYRSLAQGCLSVQDESGMWHQVLDMSSSYPESSCTAMFICSFSRGLRNGWITQDCGAYRSACEKAWNALERTAVDRNGNLYGVCRGSEFAFNPRYYSDHLLPQLNNTHGIGIVLLAGVELERLKSSYKT